MIRIISDSTCDLSDELKERFNISILPLHVLLGEKEYKDGVDITLPELFAWADENKTTPKTSAPSMEDAVNLFKPIIDAGDEIIAFSISDTMSTSGNVMRLAAAEIEAEDKVSVIDSQNLSTGIGLLVCKAAEYVEQGLSRSEVVAKIEELRPKVRASFVVDTLTYLHRGGRCSGVAAFAGSALKLHPRIAVVDGNMQPGKKYRGKYSSVVLNYVKDMEPEIKNADPTRVFITYTGVAPEVEASVKEYLEQLNIFDEICITRAGGTIASHCGYGTLGVLFIVK
ncbi:MAG: DegV family protein [Lachnospiraceae bacterium]|nr:DegV family protein [Lachnospiraceae bacterium]